MFVNLQPDRLQEYILVDDNAEPIWDEKKYREFALIVVKIDKDKVLEDFGEV